MALGRIVSLNNADYGMIDRDGAGNIRFNREDNPDLDWEAKTLVSRRCQFFSGTGERGQLALAKNVRLIEE